MCKVEEIILNRTFRYEQPWFYSNPLALRCELGVGEGKKYNRNAKKRAEDIFNILFANGVNAFFFHHYIYDYDFDTGDTVFINQIVSTEQRRLKFCLDYQKEFEHTIVRDITFDKEDNEDLTRINRIVCYPDKAFDAIKLINLQITGGENPLIHFVSFSNECIFSIYDDRGCDIVFFNKEKFKTYYPLLEKYFLAYDLDLMKQRLAEADSSY